ncbi:MAG: NAD-dependent epimerase/dehydratase family protein [Gammaproteobacteria bacterium]|nr:MAG: NAD-dependent epimerase/dehydratase family protein [Gammaproteobacteria bacterium]
MGRVQDPLKKVLVTGSGGRLARVLLPMLLSHPAIGEVRGVDLRPSGLRHPKFREWRMDTRSPEIFTIAEGCHAVIHLAFVVMGGGLGLRRFSKRLVRAMDVEGSRSVFEAASGADTLIFMSSAAVYGAYPDNPVPIREDHPLRPNPGFGYAWRKLLVERLLQDFARAHPKTRVVVMRPQAVLGPGAHPTLKAIARGPFCPMLPEPPPLVQCVHERDVARAVVLALERPVSGAFNLAAHPPMSLCAMVRLSGGRAIPVPVPVLRGLQSLGWLFTPLAGEPGWAKGLYGSLVLSTERAENLLGWRGVDTVECLVDSTAATKAVEFDKAFDEGKEDVTGQLDLGRARRPNKAP